MWIISYSQAGNLWNDRKLSIPLTQCWDLGIYHKVHKDICTMSITSLFVLAITSSHEECIDWLYSGTQIIRNTLFKKKKNKTGVCWRRASQPTPVFLSGESTWTEEPGRLQSMGLQSVEHNWMTKHSTYIK